MDKGFTFLELLIVLAVLSTITVIGADSMRAFAETSSLNSATDSVLAAVEQAHSRTLASKQSSQYGVHFQNDQVILFQGATYTAGSASNTVTMLPPRSQIATVSLTGGGNEVIFNRLTGATAQPGSIILSSRQNASVQKTIIILTTGLSYLSNVP